MSASARIAAASAVAASFFVLAFPAFSADLYDPPRTGSAYDDPRYADIYGDDDTEERYAEAEDFDAPIPPRSVYGHDEDDRDWNGYREGCVPRHVVRDRLHADGWHHLRDFEPRGGVLHVEARRDSGRLFELTIDRCSGEVVDARALDGGRIGPFADRHHRHWKSY
jgi:hypothetical protein